MRRGPIWENRSTLSGGGEGGGAAGLVALGVLKRGPIWENRSTEEGVAMGARPGWLRQGS